MVSRSLTLALVGLALCAGVAFAGPPMHPIGDRHFDHDAHAAALGPRASSVKCDRCHPATGAAAQLVDTGTSAVVDHGLCQGAGCHGDAFAKDTRCESLKGAKLDRVCAVCHIKESCFTPQPATVDHMQAQFAHGRHAALGTSIEAECAVCHTKEAGSSVAANGHKACSGCHERGVKPTMLDCATCHAGKPKAMPAQPADLAFDHGQHASASKQRSCLACHGTPSNATPFAELPPKMLGCAAGCHDGKRAFSAVGTTCTRCHRGTQPATPVRLAQPFSHADHATRGVAMDACATCHAMADNGELLEPLAGKDHAPCANSGCHQAEFASPSPKICGVCHEAVAPWQKITARATDASAKLEYFTGIDHAAHIKVSANKDANATCEQCHPAQMAGKPPRHGHRECAPCHGKGQAPVMTACAACHVKTAPPRAQANEWSVAATFRHAQHAQDPRTRHATTCVTCHTTVANATTLGQVKAPEMPRCDACHDGTHAFKSTGFSCAKCHRKTAAVVGMLP
jgi:hypothetical protein